MAKNANGDQEAEWYKQHLEKLKNIKQKTVSKPGTSPKVAQPLKRKADQGPSSSYDVKVKIKQETKKFDNKPPSLMSSSVRPVRPSFFAPGFNHPRPYFPGGPMGPRQYPPHMHPRFRMRGPRHWAHIPRKAFQLNSTQKNRPALKNKSDIKKEVNTPMTPKIEKNKTEGSAQPTQKTEASLKNDIKSDKDFKKTIASSPVTATKSPTITTVKKEVQYNLDSQKLSTSAAVTKPNTVFSKPTNIPAKDGSEASPISSKTNTVPTKNLNQPGAKASPSTKPGDISKVCVSQPAANFNKKQSQSIGNVGKLTPKNRQASQLRNDTKHSLTPGATSKNAVDKSPAKRPLSEVKTGTKMRSPAKSTQAEQSQAYLEHLQKLRGKTKTVIPNNNSTGSETKNLTKPVGSNTTIKKSESQSKNLVKNVGQNTNSPKSAPQNTNMLKSVSQPKHLVNNVGQNTSTPKSTPQIKNEVKPFCPNTNLTKSNYQSNLVKSIGPNTKQPVNEPKNFVKSIGSNIKQPVNEPKKLVTVEYPHQKPMQFRNQQPTGSQNTGTIQNKQGNIGNEQQRAGSQNTGRIQNKQVNIANVQRNVLQSQGRPQVENQAHFFGIKNEPKPQMNRQFDTNGSMGSGPPQRRPEFEESNGMVNRVAPKQSVGLHPNSGQYAPPDSTGANRTMNRQNVPQTGNQSQSYQNERHYSNVQTQQYSYNAEANMADLPISDEEDQFVTLDSTYGEEDQNYNHYQRRYRASDFFNKGEQISRITSNISQQPPVSMTTTRSGYKMAHSSGGNNMPTRTVHQSVVVATSRGNNNNMQSRPMYESGNYPSASMANYNATLDNKNYQQRPGLDNTGNESFSGMSSGNYLSVSVATARNSNTMVRSLGDKTRFDAIDNQSFGNLNNPKSILKHRSDERKRHISPGMEGSPQNERPQKIQRNITEKRLKPVIPYRERNTMEVVPSTERGQDMLAEMNIDSAMAAGLEFIHPISGYHCLLCQSFYPDYPTALHHCTLLTHKMKVLKEQSANRSSYSDDSSEQNQRIQTISTRGSMQQLNQIAKHYT